MWVAGTQVLEHDLLPPRVCVSGSLEWKAEQELEPGNGEFQAALCYLLCSRFYSTSWTVVPESSLCFLYTFPIWNILLKKRKKKVNYLTSKNLAVLIQINGINPWLQFYKSIAEWLILWCKHPSLCNIRKNIFAYILHIFVNILPGNISGKNTTIKKCITFNHEIVRSNTYILSLKVTYIHIFLLKRKENSLGLNRFSAASWIKENV